MRRPSVLRQTRLICLAVTFFITLFAAQVAQSCEISTSDTVPVRQVISCGDSVRIEREPAAELKITKSPNAAVPRVIEVKGGAILINVTPGSDPTQVRTPHAIATVRGTSYIVDAGQSQTSVFVLEGGVDVRRVNNASTLTLNAGEGTDVTLSETLTVLRWSDSRAEALLARFGR